MHSVVLPTTNDTAHRKTAQNSNILFSETLSVQTETFHMLDWVAID